jgi:hypothetical protein
VTATINFYNGTEWVSLGGGTVKSITAGEGLDGGVITDTGTISLKNTAVTFGSYDLASITVDQQGRLTAASSAGNIIAPGTFTIPSDKALYVNGKFFVPHGAAFPVEAFNGMLFVKTV